jgi:hypothetical protein
MPGPGGITAGLLDEVLTLSVIQPEARDDSLAFELVNS